MFRYPRDRKLGHHTIAIAAITVLLGLFLLVPPAQAVDLPDYEPDANAPRDQVPDAYKWDLTPLFASDAAWEKKLEKLEGEIPGLAAYQGKLGDPAALKKCLDLYFDLHDRASHVQQYANLARSTELTVEANQVRMQRSLALMEELMAAAGFIRGEVLAMDDKAMAKAYKAKDGPAEYRSYLDNLLRRRSRVLAPDVEHVLQLVGDNLWAEIDLNEIPSPIETSFRALMSDIQWPVVHDADGNEVQLALANLGRFRASTDREVRAETMTKFFATLRQFQHVFAALLGGQFKLDVTYARARNYDTALEAYMDKDGLATAVHDNLINTVNANLAPLHRYVELRKKILGLEDLHIYDLYVPMVAAAEMDVTYKEAMRILPEALEPLGEDYGKLLVEGLDPGNGWIDVYPSNDKRSGAMSASVYGRNPYVFMNYQNTLDNMSTLAHEYGHALHSYLAMNNQPYHNYRYVAFLAEVASTCNEALLSDYLVANAPGKDEKIGILAAELETIRTTIYRQTMFSEFERKVHGYVEEGTPITASLLDETYRGLVQRYYGPGFTVDENDGMEWAYIPHFYYKYYVYSYATGLCSGIAIAERVKAEGDKAVEDYLVMLKGGCSKAPLELLRGAGVDLSKPDAIESALERFDRTVTELAKLLEVEL
jgi:oligoendopeptidase F